MVLCSIWSHIRLLQETKVSEIDTFQRKFLLLCSNVRTHKNQSLFSQKKLSDECSAPPLAPFYFGGGGGGCVAGPVLPPACLCIADGRRMTTYIVSICRSSHPSCQLCPSPFTDSLSRPSPSLCLCCLLPLSLSIYLSLSISLSPL